MSRSRSASLSGAESGVALAVCRTTGALVGRSPSARARPVEIPDVVARDVDVAVPELVEGAVVADAEAAEEEEGPHTCDFRTKRKGTRGVWSLPRLPMLLKVTWIKLSNEGYETEVKHPCSCASAADGRARSGNHAKSNCAAFDGMQHRSGDAVSVIQRMCVVDVVASVRRSDNERR